MSAHKRVRLFQSLCLSLGARALLSRLLSFFSLIALNDLLANSSDAILIRSPPVAQADATRLSNYRYDSSCGDLNALQRWRKEIAAGHLSGLLQPKEEEQSRRDISENAALHLEIPVRNIDEVDEISGMSSIWGPVAVAHLLAVAVVSRDEQLTTKRKGFFDHRLDAFINGFYGLVFRPQLFRCDQPCPDWRSSE